MMFFLAELLLSGCSEIENTSDSNSTFQATSNYPDSQSTKTTYIYANRQLIAKAITIGNESHIDYMIP